MNNEQYPSPSPSLHLLLHWDNGSQMSTLVAYMVWENNFPNQPKIPTGKDAERRNLRSHAGAWERAESTEHPKGRGIKPRLCNKKWKFLYYALREGRKGIAHCSLLIA